MRGSLALLFTSGAIAWIDPAFAQEASQAGQPPSDSDDDLHNREGGEIIVTATGLKRLDMLAGTTAVEGLELQRSQAVQIGEVLMNQPGVSMSGFAPGASRPVLRGFSGNRVKLLIDGIGSIDASNVSDDHAVAVDPFNAERIDILRGPAVLLYGSQAIGGAVNIIDKRIPLRLPEETVHFDGLVSGNTAADLRQGAASFDMPLGQGFAAHLDGGYSRTGDLKVPGFTVAGPLRRDLLARAGSLEASDPSLAAALRRQATQRDVLPNSGSQTWSVTGGAAFFSGDSNLGASLGYYDTTYGVPARPASEEAEPVHIGLQQWRGDLRAVLALGAGLFDRIESRAAYSHYQHTEFEGDTPGTTFNVEGMEARAELVQTERSGWSGSTGLQYTFRHLDTVGEERVQPRNLSESIALFALQEVPLGAFRMQLAGRYEHASVSAPELRFDRRFSTVSGALGLTYSMPSGLDIGINANRVSRAPSPEELLTDGYHEATQAYERGDPSLKPERAVGGELFARGRLGPADVSVTGFYNRFTGYIYEANTGQFIDGAPVLQQMQGDADYYGAEGELDMPLVRTDGLSLKSELRASWVRAKLGDGSNVPRIPPLALFGALEGAAGAWTARGEVAWAGRQDKVAANETPTDGYTFVNASLAWRPLRGNDNVTLLLKAENIFNVTGRLATSLTKDYTPLPGRDFEASVRVSF
ncbi:TonB-dependent receptor [Tsuneonella deserti]|uniref:TonB-dependent receptor n=1 Tax=Tsuneonella deserti TaxID=2035528 RepID=A0ABQ1RZ97_9SPHN|nr:TonB-dependent receptor [Tsuneonella deserti]